MKIHVRYSDDPNDWLEWLEQPAETNVDRCGEIIPDCERNVKDEK